jgi:hypothetical protein
VVAAVVGGAAVAVAVAVTVVVVVGVTAAAVVGGAVVGAAVVGVATAVAVRVDRLLTALWTLLPTLVPHPAARHPTTIMAIRMESLLT